MKKLGLASLGMLCAALLWAAGTVQPLDVKLGLWETTMTSDSSGMPPIPPEVLAKMTPEQKARMEAMMKQRQADGPKTSTHQSCVTKQDLDKTAWFEDKKNNDEQCTRTVVSSTSRKLDAKLECARGGSKQSGTFTVEALDSTNVKGDVHMVVSGGANTMTMNSHFTSKWLGPACGTVK